MRKLYVLLVATFVCFSSNAQLTGTKAIPGDYPTIAAAVSDLNAQGVGAGGVTFNVAAGHTETLTARINLTATGTVSNQIVFQKSGAGSNPLINAYTGGTGTPATASPDGIWSLQGSDYVTINGIDLAENGSNSANALMEYGFGLFKASVTDGAQNNTITNCTITLNRNNVTTGTAPMVEGSVGILVINSLTTAATTSLTPTAASGSNSNNRFYSNTIQNANYGIALSGYAAPSPFTLGDTGNDVGGNTGATGNSIINFGGGTSSTNPSAGIRANNQWSINISYNNVNSNDGGGVNHPNTLRGIFAQAGTSANATINNNTVSVKGAGTTTSITGIDNGIGSTAASNLVTINNNTVQNCTYSTATTGAFTGILNSSSAATVNMNGNTVNNNVLSGTGDFHGIYSSGSATNLTIANNQVTGNSKTGASGSLFCVRMGTSIATISDNTIANNGFTATSGTTSSALYGIYSLASPTGETFINNTISNLSIVGAGTSASHIITGIRTNSVAGSTKNLSGNTISGLSLNSAGGSGSVYGIQTTTGATVTISRNKVSDFTASGASSIVRGIEVVSGVTVNMFNNLIGDLKAPATSSTDAIRGISSTSTSASTTLNISFNTVRLDATSTGANFGTSAMYHTTSTTSTSAMLNLRNNILVNLSTAAGTGITSAYRRSSATLTNYGSASNNNLFYAGAPSATNVIFYDGTNSDQTIDAFKTRVGPRENLSVSEDPVFLSTAGTSANFLHLDPSAPSLAESGGLNVAGIVDDYDGQTRQGNPGYTGAGVGPDMGADEFEGTNPSLATLDMGASAIVAPGSTGCYSSTQAVTVTIRNYGTTAIDFNANNVTVTTNVTGAVTQTLTATLTSGTLAPGATMNVAMTSTLDMSAGGTYNFAASTSVAGDGNATNDAINITRVVQPTVSLPQTVDFTGFTGTNLTATFPNWSEASGATSPLGTTSTWTSSTLIPGSGTTVKINLDAASDNEWIIGPKFAATSETELRFKVAITDFGSASADPVGMQGTDDRVIVRVSSDCGVSWNDVFTFNAANTVSITNSLVERTVNLSAYAGQNIIVAFFATEGTTNDAPDYDFHIDDINILNNPACIAPPTGGSAASTSLSVCNSTSFVLSVTGASTGAGLTYQWQSSPDNATWSNISGATGETFATTQTAMTYYRRQITCSGSSEFSGSVQVNQSSFANCYCSPNTGTTLHSSASACISSVTIGTISNNSGTTCSLPSYTAYPTASFTTDLSLGQTYPLSVTSSSAIVSVWIDYDQNGVFSSTEWTQVYTTGTSGTVNITIPNTALLGQTGMRIRSRGTGSANGAGDACTTFASGETEDYIITITPAPTTPCVAPADQATTLTFGTTTATSQPGSFTAAGSAPTGYLVVRSMGALNANPVDGSVYATGATLGNGIVVQSGTTTSFTASGLAGNTEYTYTVFAYNNTACLGGPAYNVSSPLSASSGTCPATPSSVTATASASDGFVITWNSSKGGNFTSPIDYTVEVHTNTGYTAPIAGSPFTITDSTTVQNKMSYYLTGLTPATTYYFRVQAAGCNTTFGTGSTTTGTGTAPDCASGIQLTECVTETATFTAGSGAWNMNGSYPSNSNGYNTNGKEMVYRFTPSTTGVYYLEITAAANTSFIDYFYKPASAGCGNTGWIGIDDNSAVGKDAIGLLQAGVEYYILLDVESNTATPSQTFRICKATTVAPASLNTCVATISLPNSIPANSPKIEYVIDADGNLIAALDFSGVPNAVGAVTTTYYVNGNALRRDGNGREYLDRNFTITTGNAPTAPVNVTLYFTNAELQTLINDPNDGNADVGSINDLRITKTSESCAQSNAVSSGGVFIAPTGNGALDASTSYVTFQTSSFSTFYLHGGLSVLPANILTFTGTRQGSANLLKWTVAQEADVDVYVVERSADGRNWQAVGGVKSLGTTTQQRSYTFTDSNVPGLKQLYRLRQVEVTGAAKLSNIVSISGVKPTVLTLAGLFPNPTAAKVNLLVDAPAKDEITLVVTDAVGRIIKTQRAFVDAGSNTVQMDVAPLAQGTYLIKVSCNSNCQSVTTRFVKQ